jgi:hypothetical protein
MKARFAEYSQLDAGPEGADQNPHCGIDKDYTSTELTCAFRNGINPQLAREVTPH